ncbi:MAG TPA: hypothetical protein VGD05_00335 [Pyrinomonadaceae bacterium]
MKWWIAEVWLIKSTWSPTDCHVFLKYLVDEQLEDKTKRNSSVWAIEMSLSQPLYWRDDNFNIKFYDDDYAQIPINRKWEKRIPEFFEELANLRSKYNNLRK